MRHVLLIALILSLVFSCHAQEQPAAQKISVNCTDVSLADALTSLGQKAQAVVLPDASVKGNLTMSLNNVTLEQALTAIANQNKLEWVKIEVSPSASEEALTARRLFAALDALKDVRAGAIMWTDPKSESTGLFVPKVDPEALPTATISQSLKLKPVYLVRAIPTEKPADSADTQRRPDRQQQQQQQQAYAPSGDVQAAANAVWGYMAQMPAEQRWDVMRQLREMMFQNMTDAEREALRQRWGGDRGFRGPRPQGGVDGRNHNHQ